MNIEVTCRIDNDEDCAYRSFAVKYSDEDCFGMDALVDLVRFLRPGRMNGFLADLVVWCNDIMEDRQISPGYFPDVEPKEEAMLAACNELVEAWEDYDKKVRENNQGSNHETPAP